MFTMHSQKKRYKNCYWGWTFSFSGPKMYILVPKMYIINT